MPRWKLQKTKSHLAKFRTARNLLQCPSTTTTLVCRAGVGSSSLTRQHGAYMQHVSVGFKGCEIMTLTAVTGLQTRCKGSIKHYRLSTMYHSWQKPCVPVQTLCTVSNELSTVPEQECSTDLLQVNPHRLNKYREGIHMPGVKAIIFPCGLTAVELNTTHQCQRGLSLKEGNNAYVRGFSIDPELKPGTYILP